MMNKFRTGQFGSPAPARGIGTPMSASLSQMGRVTYYGPQAFGTYENTVGVIHTGGVMPPEQIPGVNFVSGGVVITGGNLPPQVVPQQKPRVFDALINRFLKPRRGG